MDVECDSAPVVTSDEQACIPDSIRITRQGKLRDWVKKALCFFDNQPDRPLVLYSAPADVSTSTIARLVTVVEIIKREYLKGRDVSTGDVAGLHQYNQLLSEEQGKDKSDALHLALDGHSHVKQSYRPHMKIILSVKPIVAKRETHQAPMIRRMSKAAKARMRKRLKKQGEGP